MLQQLYQWSMLLKESKYDPPGIHKHRDVIPRTGTYRKNCLVVQWHNLKCKNRLIIQLLRCPDRITSMKDHLMLRILLMETIINFKIKSLCMWQWALVKWVGLNICASWIVAPPVWCNKGGSQAYWRTQGTFWACHASRVGWKKVILLTRALSAILSIIRTDILTCATASANCSYCWS